MALSVTDKTFAQEVLNSPMPVLVNFWAPWCGLCRLVNPLLNKVHDDLHGRVHLVSVNADENLRLANTYRLASLPTVMVFDRGQVLYRLESFHSHDELRSSVESLKTSLIRSALASTLSVS
jgi:thioredoxin 1